MAQIDTADEAQQQPPRVYAEDFPEAVVDGFAQFFGKPRLRGWIHVYAAVVALIAGAALVSVSWSVESTRAGWRPCCTRSRSSRCSRSAARITG
jgi:hemolysin III